VRATGETATTNAVSRPTDETATADAVSRPADETATADPVSRPTDWSSGETAAADPVSRPTDGSSAHRVTARATTPADFIVGRVRAAILPPVELAIAVHTGPDAEVDRTYGALGAYVASNELSVDGPVRESYLVSEFDDPAAARVTEIGWPIFRTTP
jgi:hypothetical protein